MAKKLPTVSIIGLANAGKSSIFNRMVRSRQAIVASEAGTTRDSVLGTVKYKLDDIEASFWLIDTAGLKDPDDEFEASIQDQIADATEASDVIIFVVDGTKHASDEEKVLAKKALKSKKPVILAVNKIDLKGNLPDDEYRRFGIKTVVRTSAEHNAGIDELIAVVADNIEQKNLKNSDENIDLKIALIGRPNVGKSRLFNTLAGKQQALVANVAGTTRDLNRVKVRYNKQTIEIIDTAGVRKQGKQEVGIEKFSVLRTMQAIEEADVCFLLMDVQELSTALDQKLAGVIADSGKGLVLTVSKWDTIKELHDREMEKAKKREEKKAKERELLSKKEKAKLARNIKRGDASIHNVELSFTREALASRISRNFDFVPWASLIFTSSLTGQNVTKIFDIALGIMERRAQELKTSDLNELLQKAVQAHPPAGLKNTHPKLRYMVHTDTTPPWFVVHGSNLKFLHWSYIRYLERKMRDAYDYSGTPIKFSFRDEKQIKYNKEREKQGLDPVTKAYKKEKSGVTPKQVKGFTKNPRSKK